MPIYEYRCGACRLRSSFLYQTFAAADTAERRCEHCGSDDLSRLVSRVAFHRSEDSRMEELADDSSFADVDENDPRSVARWARKMGDELGEDLGDDFREMVDRMEAGEMPDEGDGVDHADAGGADDF
ncbi:MAG: zinc ribbon domain-containing protein [Chloroflexota bacterium]